MDGEGDADATSSVAVRRSSSVVFRHCSASDATFVLRVIRRPTSFVVRRPAFVLRACSGSVGRHRSAQFQFQIFKNQNEEGFHFRFRVTVIPIGVFEKNSIASSVTRKIRIFDFRI